MFSRAKVSKIFIYFQDAKRQSPKKTFMKLLSCRSLSFKKIAPHMEFTLSQERARITDL